MIDVTPWTAYVFSRRTISSRYGPGLALMSGSMCACELIRPGMIVLPAALTTVAPAGGMTLADGPTAVMRPLVTTMVACSSGALPVPSITRAPVKAMTPGAGTCAPACEAIATSITAVITQPYFTLTHFILTFPLFNFSTFPLPRLTPARLLVGVDAERNLADDFVRQQRVGRVELPRPGVAEQPLELALLEHAEAAGEIQRAVGHAEGGLHHLVLHREDLDEPVGADAPRHPVASNGLDVRPHRLDVHRDLRHPVLHLGVIDHRPRQRDGRLRLQLLDEHLADAHREAVVDVGEPDERPRQEAGDEVVDA